MNKHIYFVTTNKGKCEEVQKAFAHFDSSIIIEQVSIELPEYQTTDLYAIAKGKAQAAFEQLQKPVLVDDGGIYLTHYHEFPGTLAKQVYQGIGLFGFWKLAQENPKGIFKAVLAYMDSPGNCIVVDGQVAGTFVQPKENFPASSLPYAEIFIPEGATKTLGELRMSAEGKRYLHRNIAIEKLVIELNKQ